MRIATVCSAHGFGHVTRELVIADALAARGAEVTLFTAAPRALLAGVRHAVVPWAADVGIAQRDSLSEDVEGTLARLETVASEGAIDALAEVLAGYDRVVVDIAPPALEAARRAGVPAFAVGNFDWAWIYRHYPALAGWAERFARWQAPHRGLFLEPGPGLTGFAVVERFGVVGRRAGPVTRGRPGARTVLVCFGGFGLDGIDAWLPRIDGVRWVLAPPMARVPRDDVSWVDDVPFPELVAGADALLTKPGYGIYAEAALAGTPMVWVDRGAFPEAPWLEAAMVARGDVKVDGRGGVAVAAALARLWRQEPPTPTRSDAAERVAARILGG
ncbi:MAG: hypothetical protein V4850_15920 [Myxococcota bacterium]